MIKGSTGKISMIIMAFIAALLLCGLCTETSHASVSQQDPEYYKHLNLQAYDQLRSSAGGPKLSIRTATRVFGIDVSAWQDSINWEKAKKAGVRFAIIRSSWAAMATGSVYKDKCFQKHINGAAKQKIPCGVYIYSQATSKKEARDEARAVLAQIKTIPDYKKKITLPVVMDCESETYKDSNGVVRNSYWYKWFKKDKVKNKKAMAEIYKAFADVIRKEGFTPMLYTYTYWLRNIDFHAVQKTGDPFWLAEYNSGMPSLFKRSYPNGRYEFWQYTSSKSVAGVAARTDCSWWYTSNLRKYARKNKSDEALAPDTGKNGLNEPDTPEDDSYTGSTSVSASRDGIAEIRLNWNSAEDAIKYVVKRDGKTIKTTTALYYTDSKAEKGKTYSYTVTPWRGADAGKPSAPVLGTSVGFGGKVSGLTASNGLSRKISLTWDPVKNADSYIVYTRTSSGKYRRDGVVHKNAFVKKGLKVWTSAAFKVKPRRNAQSGAASRAVTGVTSRTARCIAGDFTALRKGPSTKKKIIKKLPCGQKVKVLQKKDSLWYKVSAKVSGKKYTGYVYAGLLN